MERFLVTQGMHYNSSFYIVCLIVWIYLPCTAQKHQEYAVDALGIRGISIISDEISQIKINTDTVNTIRIATGIEGETYESMRVYADLDDGILKVVSNRTPLYKAIDDKLAAHKVLAVSIELKIPENLELWIESSIATVALSGTYRYININLSQGDCTLRPFYGNGMVNTRFGEIDVLTQHCAVEANSRQGKILIERSPYHTYDLSLKSLTGAIIVRQSE